MKPALSTQRIGSHGVTIRSVTAGDARSMALLCGQLGYPASEEQIRTRLAQILLDEDHAVHIAQTPDGCLIGWVHVYIPELLLVHRRAEIGGLVVDEGHRRRGIGRVLMAWAEQWACGQGCETVHLRSNILRREAHLFYEGIGYRKLTTQLTYQKTV
jgi:GNAT superfamily N-acetyltransferase